MPELPVYLIVDEKGLSEYIDFAVQNHLDGLDIHVYGPEGFAKEVQKAGLDVFVWTIDDMDNAERYYKRGVTAITSNSLTQEKPHLTKRKKLVWAIKNCFARFK